IVRALFLNPEVNSSKPPALTRYLQYVGLDICFNSNADIELSPYHEGNVNFLSIYRFITYE
ncbi:hypothetical protein, partial [Kaarinaea lacus]